jgi:hypothetical protein
MVKISFVPATGFSFPRSAPIAPFILDGEARCGTQRIAAILIAGFAPAAMRRSVFSDYYN